MKALLTILAIVMATAALAGPIQDIQTGVYPEGSQVTVNGAVVTGIRYNGFFMSEDPNAPYAGIWVYTGSAPTAVQGDLVDVMGIYKEYFDLSEIDVPADSTGFANVTGSHTGTLYPIDVTTADIAADGEPWESCFIRVTDGMQVVTAPTSYGEWFVESYEYPGVQLMFDDYWYDDTTVMIGDCYNWATGILYYGYGAFKLEPFEGGICHTDCVIPTETTTLDKVKSLYR